MAKPGFKKRLAALAKKLHKEARAVLGYPVTLGFDYSHLAPFLKFFINNIGDPRVAGTYRIEVKKIEREVIEFFRKLFNLPRNDHWGYVTTGGTEGNFFGLLVARELYRKGIVYCSQDAHYSVLKAAHLVGLPLRFIKSQPNGEMDYTDLERRLKPGRPAIIVATIGTTVKGAVDDVGRIISAVRRKCIRDFYIHCDAAFGGMFLPFIKGAPRFDFRLPIGSITVSGYKLMGSPLSCGVTMTRDSILKKAMAKNFVPYISTLDNTVSGSRSGFHSLILWSSIKENGLKGFRQKARFSLAKSEWLVKELERMGYPAWKNKFSSTVVIEKPPPRLVRKWQLASQEDISHVVVLPHTEISTLKIFLSDLKKARGRA